MSENGQVYSWSEFRKVGRQTVYRAIMGGVVSGVVAASLALWAIVEQLPGKVGLIPEGAVAAFALEGGCPIGWADYKEAWGRFVIGAVSEDRLGEIPGEFREDARESDLDARPFLIPGGEEEHMLTAEEMPEHSHDTNKAMTGNGINWHFNHPKPETQPEIPAYYPAKLADQRSDRLWSKGGNQPHNNMPPDIALYFCKKD